MKSALIILIGVLSLTLTGCGGASESPASNANSANTVSRPMPSPTSSPTPLMGRDVDSLPAQTSATPPPINSNRPGGPRTINRP